eukprot:Skav223348  [mRNA]  locus=scaffold200:371817:373482:+ [translate_table: standard]
MESPLCPRDPAGHETRAAQDMKPLLSDFSLAMRLNELKRFPIQLGLPGYTAPEILLNMEPTMQSDIFSAGAVGSAWLRLFFMTVKQQPFSDAEVASAISNNITRKIQLDHDEFSANPKLPLGCIRGRPYLRALALAGVADLNQQNARFGEASDDDQMLRVPCQFASPLPSQLRKDLLEGLMERSPLSRLDASSALAHEFLQQAWGPGDKTTKK